MKIMEDSHSAPSISSDISPPSGLSCCHVREASDPFEASKSLQKPGSPKESHGRIVTTERDHFLINSGSGVRSKHPKPNASETGDFDEKKIRKRKENFHDTVSEIPMKSVKKRSFTREITSNKSSKEEQKKELAGAVFEDEEPRIECTKLLQSDCVQTSSAGPTAIYFDDHPMPNRSSPFDYVAQRNHKALNAAYDPKCSYYPADQKPVPPYGSPLSYYPSFSCECDDDSHAAVGQQSCTIPSVHVTKAEADDVQCQQKFFLTETPVDLGYPMADSQGCHNHPTLLYMTSRLNSEERIIEKSPEVPPRPWAFSKNDKDSLRGSTTGSCISSGTRYANTSDLGAPESRYLNVFESSFREESVERAQFCWQEEPIYATVGEQCPDGKESPQTSLHYNIGVKHWHSLNPSIKEENDEDLNKLRNARHLETDKSSLSSSTQTLCPEEPTIVVDDAGKDNPDGRKVKRLASSKPPKLPPKTLDDNIEPPDLPSKAMSEPPHEIYGLRIRLPLLRSGSCGVSEAEIFHPPKSRPVPPPRCSSMPYPPPKPVSPRLKEVVSSGDLHKRGPLYVVIGTSSAIFSAMAAAPTKLSCMTIHNCNLKDGRISLRNNRTP
ncbi:uncharacterized protein LOC135221314 [Macrobrachium nipponense]|uniref:uncharacterized protein LOC135221314 n=1 Tax=Macrobrachium nipponense TaxID=159736 RepID=UPI0030C85866